jgi:hypothetical protein
MMVVKKQFATGIYVHCRKDADSVSAGNLNHPHNAIGFLSRVVDEAGHAAKALRIDHSLLVSLKQVALIESIANEPTPVALLLTDPLPRVLANELAFRYGSCGEQAPASAGNFRR